MTKRFLQGEGNRNAFEVTLGGHGADLQCIYVPDSVFIKHENRREAALAICPELELKQGEKVIMVGEGTPLGNALKRIELLEKEIAELNEIWADRFPDCICNRHEKRYCASHSDGADC